MDSDLMQEFNIVSPMSNDINNAASGEVNFPGGGITDINSRIEQVFGNAQPAQGTQPAENAQPQQVSNPQTIPQPAQQPGQQPALSVQPKPVETDPVKLFAEASPKAFFTSTGDLDTAKINDYFLTNGKSFMKIAESSPIDFPAPVMSTIESKVDPQKEYNDKLSYMAEHLEEEVAARRAAGVSEDQINAEITAYYAQARSELKAKQDLRAAIVEETKRLAPELEQARQDRITALISKNISDLSQGLDGLVQGLSGHQILNQFMLDPKYGGSEVDRMFLRDNPGADKLDVTKRSELAKNWFQTFQQDRRAMAHVAEFGRLRWMVENFKPILEHAQSVGAGKVGIANEAFVGAPSKHINNPVSNQKNSFDSFFGVDSVN